MRTSATLIVVGLLISGQALAQDEANPVTPWLQSVDVPVDVDSGFVSAQGPGEQLVFTTEIFSEGASWLRLRFDEAFLSGLPGTPNASYLMITSHLDGAVQYLNAEHVKQWQNTSAYFNGDRVTVDLIAFEGTGENRLVMTSVIAGVGPVQPETICGPTDDRILSDDKANARALPIGCTAWIFDDCQHCLLTAGHCQGGANVIQFNVPLSNGEGGLNHPPPEDQYARDPSSTQGNGGQGVGSDWAYFGCFPNANTGLTPYEAQQESYTLADVQPPVQGQDIRITGYGSGGQLPEWNQVQKTHAGPFVTSNGSTVQYQADTTGGNSGSPVIDDSTGLAIGIHTHGGCNVGGGANSGTGISHGGLIAALLDPQGVCECPGLTFEFPGGLPDVIDPAGGTVLTVQVVGDEVIVPEPGSGVFHYDIGDGFVSVPMDEIGEALYEAVFPAVDCFTSVAFYVSAMDTEGELYTSPGDAPDVTHLTISATETQTVLFDDLEQDGDWTVGSPEDTATTGIWERGNPVGTEAQPENDHTEGGTDCYFTGQGVVGGGIGDNDVDNGFTTLTSPAFDLSGADAVTMSYWRWYDNDKGNAPNTNVFVIDISDDGGDTWTNLETIGPSGPGTFGGWIEHEFNVGDFVALTDSVMLRFIAEDDPADGQGSIVEAAIDDLEIVDVICESSCPADFNGDGELSILDFVAFQIAFVNGEDAADFNGDGELSILDFVSFQEAFVQGCP